ncbi:MAG TPA: hypothetical protein ENI23_01305 [bacterium]|nr:hypothetical protein [bacterium]
MAIEKVFRIKLNTDTKGLVGGLRKGAAGSAGLGGLAGGPLIAGIGLIVSQLKVFQPVVNMVKTIVNVLGQFLRPVSDVILLLLMPILQILKPILVVVRQIMQPFRQLAFSLSRQASQALQTGQPAQAASLFALSIGAIGTGVQAVLGFFVKEFTKSFLGGLGEIFKVIFPFFAGKIDEGVGLAKDAIDFGIASLITTQSFLIVKAADVLGADVSKEFSGIVSMMDKLFIGPENSFASVFNSMTDIMQDQINPSLNDAAGNFLGGLNSFVDGINQSAGRIGSGRQGGGGRRVDLIERSNIFGPVVSRAVSLLIPGPL